jgi:N-dimethylarginine dimethylaminohydrolase
MTISENPKLGTLAGQDACTPTRMDRPVFLVNPPFTYDTADANNVWMEELEAGERRVDRRVAIRQFLELYHVLSAEALVYVLPAPGSLRLQDLVFTANLGIVLEHVPGRDVVVLSNFTAKGRRGETEVGRAFFGSLGYEVHVSPHRFEGEAELKHLYDDVYVGGHGIRTDGRAYGWMEERFGMRVVPLHMTDPYLYHLDTAVFPLTRETTLVCTEAFDDDELRVLEDVTEIIDVSAEDCYSGLCNTVRVYNGLVNASNLHELKRGTEDYRCELAKNRRLEDIAAERGFELTFVNLSEFLKGGALLSCMVMHLNRRSYDIRLL